MRSVAAAAGELVVTVSRKYSGRRLRGGARVPSLRVFSLGSLVVLYIFALCLRYDIQILLVVQQLLIVVRLNTTINDDFETLALS